MDIPTGVASYLFRLPFPCSPKICYLVHTFLLVFLHRRMVEKPKEELNR